MTTGVIKYWNVRLEGISEVLQLVYQIGGNVE